MGRFTIVILWKNGTSGVEGDLTWPDVQAWMRGIHETASQDLVSQVLVMSNDLATKQMIAQKAA